MESNERWHSSIDKMIIETKAPVDWFSRCTYGRGARRPAIITPAPRQIATSAAFTRCTALFHTDRPTNLNHFVIIINLTSMEFGIISFKMLIFAVTSCSP